MRIITLVEGRPSRRWRPSAATSSLVPGPDRGRVARRLGLTYDLQGSDPPPRPRSAAVFIITGSSSSVEEQAPWMKRAESLVRDIAATTVPLLAVCFGRQLIAHALGGEVGKNPRGRENRPVRVRPLADDLRCSSPSCRGPSTPRTRTLQVLRPPRGPARSRRRGFPLPLFPQGTSACRGCKFTGVRRGRDAPLPRGCAAASCGRRGGAPRRLARRLRPDPGTGHPEELRQAGSRALRHVARLSVFRRARPPAARRAGLVGQVRAATPRAERVGDGHLRGEHERDEVGERHADELGAAADLATVDRPRQGLVLHRALLPTRPADRACSGTDG